MHGASEWLVRKAEIDLVTAAATGAEAIELAGRLAPDLVLLDESVPDMKTPEVVQRIKKLPDAPRVVLLSFLDGGVTQRIAAATGADLVVAKSRFTEALLPALADLFEDTPLATSSRSDRPRLRSPLPARERNTRSES